MGLYRYTTTTNLSEGLRHEQDNSSVILEKSNNLTDEEFLFWFSGFTDAEGNFLITIDRKYIKTRFKINLHIDDIEVLYVIKSKLGFGRVVKEINSCAFIVEDALNIGKLCQIFNKYPLHTSKKLDFLSFCEAITIKSKSKVLSEVDLDKIISIKNSMNSKRTNFTSVISKSQIIINPNWFIGFLEGEGTFGIKTGSSLYFQVAQKNTSQECLNAITFFLVNLPNSAKSKILSDVSYENKISLAPVTINVTNSINQKTNVVSLVISSVDSLYYYLLPYLNESKFYSRKYIDFNLWKMALLLKIHGYYYTVEGKNLFLDISEILNKRYTTDNIGVADNVENIINDITERFNLIMQKDPPFDVNLNILHAKNVRDYSILTKTKEPKTVYIYSEDKMIEGSPFNSFSMAHKALGLKPSSNTCNRYIDTNRLYKNKYIFTSKPIDRASRN